MAGDLKAYQLTAEKIWPGIDLPDAIARSMRFNEAMTAEEFSIHVLQWEYVREVPMDEVHEYFDDPFDLDDDAVAKRATTRELLAEYTGPNALIALEV